MEVYIGLDVSLASTAVCVLGEKGEIVTEAQVASAPESLVSFMCELPHGIAAIGLEAGPLSSMSRVIAAGASPSLWRYLLRPRPGREPHQAEQGPTRLRPDLLPGPDRQPTLPRHQKL